MLSTILIYSGYFLVGLGIGLYCYRLGKISGLKEAAETITNIISNSHQIIDSPRTNTNPDNTSAQQDNQ